VIFAKQLTKVSADLGYDLDMASSSSIQNLKFGCGLAALCYTPSSKAEHVSCHQNLDRRLLQKLLPFRVLSMKEAAGSAARNVAIPGLCHSNVADV
jgi:hypothetical protein